MTTTTPVRVTVVGAGWWATDHHLPALLRHPDARVVAVCDPVEARARALADPAGAQTFASLTDALAAGGIDAVVVSTPSASHHRLAAAALDAGLPTFVEKPLTLTAADAVDLLRRAESAGTHLMVGYTHQFESGAAFARTAVREHIGRLVQVTVEFSSRAGTLYAAAESGGTAGPGQHPEAYSAANGGGQAHTQLSHALGMLCWVTGDEVATVAAVTDHRGLSVDVDDAAAFRLRGGATGVAVSSGATAPLLPARQHIRYLGTDGVVEQDLHHARVVLHRADGSQVVREPGQHEPAYRAGEPVRAFVDLVLGRGKNPAPARPAAAAVAATEALLTAAATGTVVDVPSVP